MSSSCVPVMNAMIAHAQNVPGVVGLALAMAGADVVLTDLPHITLLTQRNVDANCRQTVHRAQVRGASASRRSQQER